MRVCAWVCVSVCVEVCVWCVCVNGCVRGVFVWCTCGVSMWWMCVRHAMCDVHVVWCVYIRTYTYRNRLMAENLLSTSTGHSK